MAAFTVLYQRNIWGIVLSSGFTFFLQQHELLKELTASEVIPKLPQSFLKSRFIKLYGCAFVI